MLAASNMSRITLSKSSFSFGVSSHLVRGSLSFTRSSASIVSLFGFICVRQGNFVNAVDTSAEFLILFLNRTAMVLCDEILQGFCCPGYDIQTLAAGRRIPMMTRARPIVVAHSKGYLDCELLPCKRTTRTDSRDGLLSRLRVIDHP